MSIKWGLRVENLRSVGGKLEAEQQPQRGLQLADAL